MQASHNALLNLQHLPINLSSSACKATVQPDLQKSLILLGQLCDHGCDYVLLDRQYASIIKDGITTVIGLRDPTNGLWLMDLEPSGAHMPLPTKHPTYVHCANSAYEQKTKTQLIDFLHRVCFSPPISTWTQAIEKKFLHHLARPHCRRRPKISPQIPCHSQRSPKSHTQKSPIHHQNSSTRRNPRLT
jgi:hypothetical protein